MIRQTIKVKTEKEIELITPVLVLRGYTVRVTTVQKKNSSAKQKVLEFWEEEK